MAVIGQLEIGWSQRAPLPGAVLSASAPTADPFRWSLFVLHFWPMEVIGDECFLKHAAIAAFQRFRVFAVDIRTIAHI